MDAALLNSLYPFAFISDSEGEIVSVGRSLLRLFPSILNHRSLFSAFKIERPVGLPERPQVVDLLDDLLVLIRADDPSFRLRGQVVRTSSTPAQFIFAVTPALTNVEQIRSMNLLLSDFPLGEPVLDFLLFMQQQRASQHSLEIARQELEWENRTSTLLYKIVLATQESVVPADAYRDVLEIVCSGLSWEVGHVFVRDPEEPSRVCSSEEWYVEAGVDITGFKQASERAVCNPGEGLLGRCLEAREIQWVPRLADCTFYMRPSPLPGSKNVAAVAIPIIEEGVVTAVFEFYTSRDIPNSLPLQRLFGLLGIQVSNILERMNAKRRESEHLAALIHASKMASLGEIVAGVAHELNNPLYTLAMIAQLLKRMNDRGTLSQTELQTQVDRIETSVERMSKIVLELRDFSRDSSKDPMREVNLDHLIAQTTDLCYTRFQNGGVELVIESVPSNWLVECRESQILQVLLNLLNNAFDACRRLNTRWINVRCADEGDAYTIRVTDSGLGIEPTIAKRIMNPFFTTKPPGEGTGLGLSISSNILTDHGGSVRLDRESPHTSFVVTIPKQQPRPHLQKAV